MDIYSKSEYPSGALSNFAAHAFTLDGISCAGMEGFLQALKYKNPKEQIEICKLTGKKAKVAGDKKFAWRLTQTIWWQGKKIKRHSREFQDLIDRAYDALYENKTFREALLASGNEPLIHTIGTHDSTETILTEHEFTARLLNLRSRLQAEMRGDTVT